MEHGILEHLQVELGGYSPTASELLSQAITHRNGLLQRLTHAYEEQQQLIDRYEEMAKRNMELRREVRALQERLDER